jgi:hypothetical protein
MGEHYRRTRTFRRFPTISDGIIHPADGTVGITSPSNYAIPSPERNSVEQWRRPPCRDASPLVRHRIVRSAPCLPGLSCPAPDDEFRTRPNRGPELRAWTSTVAHRAPARSLEVENCAGRGRRAAVSLDTTPNISSDPVHPKLVKILFVFVAPFTGTPDQELVSGPDTAGHAARCRPFVPHRHPLICSGIEPRPFRARAIEGGASRITPG